MQIQGPKEKGAAFPAQLPTRGPEEDTKSPYIAMQISSICYVCTRSPSCNQGQLCRQPVTSTETLEVQGRG